MHLQSFVMSRPSFLVFAMITATICTTLVLKNVIHTYAFQFVAITNQSRIQGLGRRFAFQNISSISQEEHLPGKTVISWKTREKCWRPTVQDVERISWGKPAKKKGTGSRGVPHRLNHEEERTLFDQARRKGFLEINGSGWRSQRRDAPLINTYRSLCDARGQVCIILHKGNTGLDDELVIDLSPLRLPQTFESLGKDIIAFVGMPVEQDYEIETSLDSDNDNSSNNDENESTPATNDDIRLAWEERPIYQLNPYCISWKMGRSDGKLLGKKLAEVFNTVEPNASASKKPNHVKPGKNRRSGGYGIG